MRIIFSKIVFRISLGVLAWAISYCSFAKCKTSEEFLSSLEEIKTSQSINSTEKLQAVNNLLVQYEQCGLVKDSVYVGILERIAKFTYDANKDLPEAIAINSIAINHCRQNKSASSKFLIVKLYSNQAFYYSKLNYTSKALAYYDTAIQLAANTPLALSIEQYSRLNKVILLEDIGDYQKCIEESTIGIQQVDNPYQNRLRVKRAESFLKKGEGMQASFDVKKILADTSLNDNWTLVNALRILALIHASNQQYRLADSLFQTAMDVASDATALRTTIVDFGNYLVIEKRDLESAKKFYQKLVDGYSDNQAKADAYINISQVYWRQKKYSEAESYYLKALGAFQFSHSNSILNSYTSSQWNLIANKYLLMVMLNNHTELLLTRYKISRDKKYLDAALKAAIIADSVISMNRRDQVEEQSKLFWRQRTREFYQYAIEASYLAKQPASCFYFMEKSRAVLLNDKINELAAQRRLPASVSQKEQELNLKVLQQQITANAADDNAGNLRVQLIEAKSNLEQYIKTLEKDYPAYYKVKYADQVPTLEELQSFLAKNQQSFVHYFMADTVAYIMTITASNCDIQKVAAPAYDKEKIIAFLNYCSQPAKLNANFKEFVSLSDGINQHFFQPLNLPKGRVIICPDNFLIPFDALVTNGGTHYLVQDYAFSYVYSARNLLAQFPLRQSNGNFMGIAPVSFASYLKVPPLKASGNAIKTSGAFYDTRNMFIGDEATKSSFLSNIGRYEVVNVFSHALADSSITEPAIYMGDSVIYLSELQLINDISAQLVLLSACQTSVGKNATGEGIYSLARGLASVGIPAVAATLWEADEAAIYAISEKFNEGISKGLPKDIAMQQAKIWYLSQASKEQTLPAYWANMILIGNASPVQFSEHRDYHVWVIIATAVIALVILIVVLWKRRSSRSVVAQQNL